MKKLIFLLLFLTARIFLTDAQSQVNIEAEQGRNILSSLKTCYDVSYYDLEIKIAPELGRIAGSNKVFFEIVDKSKSIQIDLESSLKVSAVIWQNRKLRYQHSQDALIINFPYSLVSGSNHVVQIYYGGSPRESIHPPLDGGIIWNKDKSKSTLISTCTGKAGASSWFPAKDQFTDKADSMSFSLIVSDPLMAISAGQLEEKTQLPGYFSKYRWKVNYPILPHQVNFFVGAYEKMTQTFFNGSGKHTLDFYTLKNNSDKASQHFHQVSQALKCYENYLGSYPFWKDGFKIVETHYSSGTVQNTVTYAGKFKNNEFGFDPDLASTIAQQWFGNALGITDPGQAWIQDGFSTYMASLFLESLQGDMQSIAWMEDNKRLIRNQYKITAPSHIHFYDWQDDDRLYKGAWILHMLRNLVDNDSKWFSTLKKLYEKYQYKALDTDELIQFFSQALGKDYQYLFREYILNSELPKFEFQIERKGKKQRFTYRWNANTPAFSMPVFLQIGTAKSPRTLIPSSTWREEEINFRRDELYFDNSRGLYEIIEVDDEL